MKFIQFLINQSRILLLVFILLTLLHYFFGSSKWQYYPLYLLSFFYFILLAFESLNLFTLNFRQSKWAVGISVFLILLTLLTLFLFPKTELPKPSGDFAIGTQTFELEDLTRDEEYSEDQGAKRKIKYQVWYPTDSTKNLKQAKWLAEGNLVPRTLVKSLLIPMPSFILDQVAKIDSNSYKNAHLSQELQEYPILIISHGWRGFRELHADFAEDLASNGYIVFSIDHSYGSEAVKFEDGSVAYLNQKALPRIARPSTFGKAAVKLAINYGRDVKMVLDDLEVLNKEDDDFKERLALDKIALLGHSAGGAGDVYTGLRDKRVKALIGLDAWMKPLDPAELEKGLKMPSLFLRSEQWKKRENNKALARLLQNSTDARVVEMRQIKHLDFPMVYMFSPYTKYIGLTGRLGGRKSSKIQMEIVRDFLDQHLKDKDFDKNYLENYVEQYDYLELGERE